MYQAARIKSHAEVSREARTKYMYSTTGLLSETTCADPEGGGGAGGLDPLKNHIAQYWFASPGKAQSYQPSIQFWAIIGPLAKRHLHGVSLAGR